MEKTIVCKFGGTCIAGEAYEPRIKQILEENDNRRIIVVSAPGKSSQHATKVTDLLINAYMDRNNFNNYLDKVESRFQELIQALNIEFNIKHEIRKMKRHFRLFKSRSYLISRGEYLCAKIFSIYLGIKFIDASKLIKFNNGGKIAKSTYKRIKKAFNKYRKFIIPGFYGSNSFGKIKLMSRGGSDITGAIIINAINDSLYENWTDVDGLFCDNNLRNKDVIRMISYYDLQFLSFFGANVIHYKCCSICNKNNTYIKNLFNLNSSGTLIMNFRHKNIYAHTFKRGIEFILPNNKHIEKIISKTKAEILYKSVVLSKSRLIIAENRGYDSEKYMAILRKCAKHIQNVRIDAYICNKSTFHNIKNEHEYAHIIESNDNHHLIITQQN